MKIPFALVRLLSRSVTPDKLGGIFKFADSDSFADAIDDIDQAEFSPFARRRKINSTLLKRVVDAELIEPDLRPLARTCVDAGRAYGGCPGDCRVAHRRACQRQEPAESSKRYLAAYENFMATIRDRYEAVSVKSAKGARHLCAQLLLST